MKALIISLLLTGIIMGQQVVELKQPNSAKLIVKFMFKNGSICDPAGKEGLTYTTSQLITQGGTGELTFGDIQDKIYPMAANYYSSVDKEVTIFTFEFHRDWMDQFYPIMIGLITNPTLTQADFDRVKTNQQAYVDQVIRASSDEEYSKKALEDFLFRGTNYQHMVEGKSSSVSSITLEDVKDYYKNFFTKNNLMIGIAGNYPASFIEKLKSDIQKLPDTKPAILSAPVLQMPDGIDVEIISKEGAFGSAIFTGYPLNITRADDEFAALMVANSYLGEHRKSYSKLYQVIREQRSMNYGDYSYIEWYNNGGGNMVPPSGVPRQSNYFAIWIRPVQIAKQLKMQYEELKDVNVGHAHFALRMALREMDKMIKNGLSQEDFEATRAFLESYIRLYIKSPEQQLGYLMDSKMYGRVNYIEELGELLSKLTLEDVNNAIKKYFQIDNMKITIVTDVSEAEPLAKSLKENSTSPMSYSNLVKAGLPEEILKEDAATENFKLNVKNVTIVDSKDTFK
ncbi:MAG: insulinase family protein [Ignavibacteriaceae bacterium]|nr:insulinase family protein [Ignavibacteriaceae bacterium]